MKSSSQSFLKVLLIISIVFPGLVSAQNPALSHIPGEPEPQSADISFSIAALDSQYHDNEELGEELNNLSQLYPSLTRLDTIGYSQQFKRPIWAMKVSDNADVEEDEPAVLFVANIHANEIFGVEMCSMLLNELLESYGKDSAITRLLDSTAVWFIPTMNPDGFYAITHGIYGYWRKNGRDVNNNGVFYESKFNHNHEGVNLNRNFGYMWPGPETDIWSTAYCGETPFSESETRAIRDFATLHSLQLSISIHSWSEMVLFPYWIGTAPYVGTWIPTKDDSVVVDIATNMAARMKTMKNSSKTYFVDNSATEGFMDSWLYKEFGTYQFLIEMLPYPLFVIPGNQLEKVYNDTKEGFMYLIERAHGPGLTGHITDEGTGKPLYAEVRILQAYEPLAGPRMTAPAYGRYYHYLKPGKYDVRIVKEDYEVLDFTDVIVKEGKTTILDAALKSKRASVITDKITYNYSLEQNYPNPFNSATNINYYLPEQSPVKLNIYNAMGQIIAELLNETQSAGKHEVKFNASNLVSGVYFLRIEAGQFIESKKMILLK